jgi:hypothetical protein
MPLEDLSRCSKFAAYSITSLARMSDDAFGALKKKHDYSDDMVNLMRQCHQNPNIRANVVSRARNAARS